jgi:hypothetical protein
MAYSWKEKGRDRKSRRRRPPRPWWLDGTMKARGAPRIGLRSSFMAGGSHVE